jgi:hypothetical protein
LAAAVIADADRTPLPTGKPGGAYADIHPVDLHAHVLAAPAERWGIDPAACPGLVPRARVHSLAVVGDDPIFLLPGTIERLDRR